MKRFLAILTAAVLCLGLVSAAAAETSLQQVYQFNAGGGADAISGSYCIEAGDRDAKALVKMDGTQLTDGIYYSIRCQYGYFVVTEPEARMEGILNADGQVVAPTEYDDIQTLNEYWAAGVKLNTNGTKEDHDYTIWVFGGEDQYALIDSVDLYNVKEGKLMATLTRDQYQQATASGEYLNIYERATQTVHQYDGSFQQLEDPRSYYSFPQEEREQEPEPYKYYYEDGKYGVKDAEDNVTIAAQFDYIQDIVGDLVKVKIGDFYGLYDVSGNMLIPAEYNGFDYLSSKPEGYPEDAFDAYGYIAVKKDDKIGYYSVAEKAITAEPLYGTSERAYNYGVSQIRQVENVYCLYSADGADRKLEEYSGCYSLDYTLGRYYYVYGENGKGMIDWHGNEVLPCIYNEIDFFPDGRHVMAYESETDTVTVFEVADEFVQ